MKLYYYCEQCQRALTKNKHICQRCHKIKTYGTIEKARKALKKNQDDKE